MMGCYFFWDVLFIFLIMKPFASSRDYRCFTKLVFLALQHCLMERMSRASTTRSRANTESVVARMERGSKAASSE
jgi:hypothetical protein